jgi:hypothetical protein
LAAVTVYGLDFCRFTNRTRGQLDGLRVAYDFVDLGNQAGRPLPGAVIARQQTPTVAIQWKGGTQRLIRPDDWQLQSELIRCGLIDKRKQRPASRSVMPGPRAILGER